MSLPTTAPAAHAASSTAARHVSHEIGDVEARVQRLDRPDDPVELLGLGDLGPGPGLHAADVEEVGALGRRARSARRRKASSANVAPWS